MLPLCPATLNSVMREAKSPLANLEKVAQLISSDAGMVAPLLKLVQNIALRQSLAGEGNNFEKFWERSSLSATVAEKMAAKFPNISRNDACITALFHDSGIPVLIQKYPDYRAKVMSQGQRASRSARQRIRISSPTTPWSVACRPAPGHCLRP